MRVGVPRECKDGEQRVGLTPAGARALIADGHTVVIAAGAGAAVGFADADYLSVGIEIAASPEALWSCELIVKVKELQPSEFALLVPGTTVFAFAQLHRDPALLEAVLAARIRIIAYEAVRDAAGALPLLAPMSRIAGRLAPFAGAQALATDRGGSGVLLPGVDDVPGANVVIVGAGSVGSEAARVAAQIGCKVCVFSRGEERRTALARSLKELGHGVATYPLSGPEDARFCAAVIDADLVIGAVLEPGMLSPKLLRRALVRSMRRGSALIDVGIDQGGIAETSRMTKLSAPTYVEEGVVHYAVPNMPALVARTATLALTQATLPQVRALAGRGISAALAADPGLRAGAMVWQGAVIHAGLAADVNVPLASAP
ncbi:MAG: alanine dehydrogenase [Betaproteobacteria bacterium]|nr:alanine dehydrogenase [Betaproteobacteria bacterium]